MEKKVDSHAKRVQSMQQGNRFLQLWLSDQIRQGLASLQAQPAAYWDDFAALMVDSKLGAIARRIQRIKDYISQTDNFDQVINELAELHLFSQGFQRIEQLPEPFAADLLQLGGLSMKKEEVLRRGAGTKDYWLVMGVHESAEEKLKMRRTWLLGESSAKFALILDFAWGHNPFEATYRPGSALSGEVVFYPGNVALRGILREGTFGKHAFQTPSGIADLGELAQDFSKLLSHYPWLRSYPYILTEVVPVLDGNNMVLLDGTGKMLRMKGKDEHSAWKVLSIGGHRSLDVFGEWDGEVFVVFSVFKDGRLIIL